MQLTTAGEEWMELHSTLVYFSARRGTHVPVCGVNSDVVEELRLHLSRVSRLMSRAGHTGTELNEATIYGLYQSILNGDRSSLRPHEISGCYEFMRHEMSQRAIALRGQIRLLVQPESYRN